MPQNESTEEPQHLEKRRGGSSGLRRSPECNSLGFREEPAVSEVGFGTTKAFGDLVRTSGVQTYRCVKKKKGSEEEADSTEPRRGPGMGQGCAVAYPLELKLRPAPQF